MNLDYLKTHAIYIVAMAAMAMGGRAWLEEHDARLLAEQKVKDAETRIVQIQQQANVKALAIRKAAKAIQTPQEAVQAVPDLSVLPLNAKPLIGAPEAVQVDWKPLVEELSACKADRVQLDACKAIAEQKDAEISALGKKKGFWRRFGQKAKDVGIGIGIGLGIAAAGGVL